MSALAIAPALPLHSAGKYVAGAYIVFVAVILIYLMIMAVRLGRTERALVDLNRDIALREEASGDPKAAGSGDPIAHDASSQRDRDEARLAGAGRSPGDSSL